jgi:hypothetical protein
VSRFRKQRAASEMGAWHQGRCVGGRGELQRPPRTTRGAEAADCFPEPSTIEVSASFRTWLEFNQKSIKPASPVRPSACAEADYSRGGPPRQLRKGRSDEPSAHVRLAGGIVSLAAAEHQEGTQPPETQVIEIQQLNDNRFARKPTGRTLRKWNASRERSSSSFPN